jgi:hypothetical protein
MSVAHFFPPNVAERGNNRASKRAIAASFIVDQNPTFAYMGWHLAHSLVARAHFRWPDIHVHFTPEVSDDTISVFSRLGCTTHILCRFGDGKYCNKIGQWENLRNIDADHLVLLDTDMICVSGFVDMLPIYSVAGKVVDLPNPELELLSVLFQRMGFADRPDIIKVDASDARTFRGNCNGGFYSIPRQFAEPLFGAWRKCALSLLDNPEILRIANKEAHIDQIAFCMAVHGMGIPFEHISSNLNYYAHFPGTHAWRDADRPIAVLHYHNHSLNVVGLLEPAGAREEDERSAIDDANRLIAESFNTKLFWEMRYDRFPDRGSGVGSRGENLTYKRALLQREGAEDAESILDIGCGDLEVVRSLNLAKYVGMDCSEASLARARAARPDWKFLRAPASEAPEADMVLCFEVAIHQETSHDYHQLIEFAAKRTQRTLIISGYDELTDEIDGNHMLYFYEPLKDSLERTGKFGRIRKIGEHSSVVVYRCDIAPDESLSKKCIRGLDAWNLLVKGKYGRWEDRIKNFGDQLVHVHHEPKFMISADDRFFCMGSCFARNIEEHLIYLGIDVLSKRIFCPAEEYPGRINAFVNKFSTHSMANEVEWVAEPPQFDAQFFTESDAGWNDLQLSPGIPPVTFERVVERRRYLTSEYFNRVRDATVLILTLGLDEVWHDSLTNRHLNAAPSFFSVRREPSRYSMKITDAVENIAQLEKIYAAVRSINPEVRMVVTVSPVPMSATFSGDDVLVANVRSKSTLRVAAESFAQSHDAVDYFPSFDMVSMSPRHRAYEGDGLHVENAVVGEIMQSFIRLYMGLERVSPIFNESAYVAANPDVEAAIRRAEFSSGFEHWERHGKAEGRRLAPTSGPFAFSWLQTTGS